MNYNDLPAQQQALLEYWQPMGIGMLLFFFVGLIASGLIIYLFQARLRDIAVELRKLRIDYEFSLERQARSVSRNTSTPSVPLVGPDAKYRPRN